MSCTPSAGTVFEPRQINTKEDILIQFVFYLVQLIGFTDFFSEVAQAYEERKRWNWIKHA